MKTIIAGSRCISEYIAVVAAVANSNFDITEVVSGTAKGVDKLGEHYAKMHDLPVKLFPAQWKDISIEGAVIKQNQYGKYNAVAGHQRNIQMGDYADALIAIWDGKSNGTMHMIKYMKSLGKVVYVHEV